MNPGIHFQYEFFRTDATNSLSDKLGYMAINFWRVHTFLIDERGWYCVMFERDLGRIDEWPAKNA